MVHGDLNEKLALHALGALEPGEAAELEAHVRGCQACTAELADLSEAAAELARAAGSIPPSAALTHRILEAARSEPRLAAVPSAADRAPGGARPAPRRGGPLRVPRPVWAAAAIAAAAVVALLAVAQVRLQDRLDRANDLLARGRELLELLASPGVTTIALSATDRAPDVHAFLALDRHSGTATLVAFDVPPPPPGRIYQLWEISEGVHPVATFSTATGGGLLHARWSPEPRKSALFVVTLEPSSGVDEPTGDVLLIGVPPPSGPPLGR